MSVINLNAWKNEKKQKERKSVLHVSPVTGKVTGKPTLDPEAVIGAFPKINFDNNLNKVRASIDKINKLIADLKEINEKYSGLR